jgi:S1-C subfamily serine protease
VGNKSLTGKVIGEFPPDDIAVIRVEGNTTGLKPAKFANSNTAQIGEIVLAMGNPLGLTDSVTQGIISATGRIVGADEPTGGKALITAAIQTSAAINPGNSGGALVTLDSEVIGIPTLAAKLPGEGGAAPGIGFAIPSNTVRNIAPQLITTGKVVNTGRGTLGITAQTSASKSGNPAGVAVLAVAGGSTAAQAGPAEGRHHRRPQRPRHRQPRAAGRIARRPEAGRDGDHPLHARQQHCSPGQRETGQSPDRLAPADVRRL